MNERCTPKNPVLRLALAVASILAAAAAQAELLSPSLYAEQLERCVAELRSDMSAPGTARLRHELTAVDRTELWYVFAIRSTALDESGAVTDRARANCRAHRWTEQTVARIEHEAPVGVAGRPRVAAND